MKTFEVTLNETQEYGVVQAVAHGIVSVSGLPGAFLTELVVFEEEQWGIVWSLGEARVEVMVLVAESSIHVGMRATRAGVPFAVKVGEGMLGQMVDSLGDQLTTKAAPSGLKEERVVDVGPRPMMERAMITKPFESGIALVDLLIPLSVGQRELVIGDHKIGKTQLLRQMATAHARRGGLVVYAAIAKRATELAAFKTYFEGQKVVDKLVMVVSHAAQTGGSVFLTPYTAMTVAEYFKDQGKEVLVIFDDLTIHAKYYRELSLVSGRYPGRSAYPGDVFWIHARLMERAGQFKKGSITALPVAETVMGDISGYIQTNLMSMTDGHIYFDMARYNQGRRPAIDPFLSVTRVGRQTQTPVVRALSLAVSEFMAEVKTLQDLVHFGGELTDRVKKNLHKYDLLMAILQQPDDLVLPLPVVLVLVGVVMVGMAAEMKVEDFEKTQEKVCDTYMIDSVWKKYLDGLMTLADWPTLAARLKQDISSLKPLLGEINVP